MYENSLLTVHLAVCRVKQIDWCCLGREWLCAEAIVGNKYMKILWQYAA
jgi:hypothetical protein